MTCLGRFYGRDHETSFTKQKNTNRDRVNSLALKNESQTTAS